MMTDQLEELLLIYNIIQPETHLQSGMAVSQNYTLTYHEIKHALVTVKKHST